MSDEVEAERPSLGDLWKQAGGGTDQYDLQKYLKSMREHGHVLRDDEPRKNQQDLIAFLKARLDEDEATAKAAASVVGPDWRHEAAYTELDEPYSYIVAPSGTIVIDTRRGPDDEEIGPYLAEHDPARVLREVAAKRKILTRYRLAVAAPEPVVSFTRGQDDGYREACMDAIVALTAVYSDHPDYRQEWAPGDD